MKRINPDQVVEAFRFTKLKPLQEEYFGDGCACAFGALYIMNGGTKLDASNVDEFADKLTGNNQYAWGFMMGFDGDKWMKDDRSEAFRMGWDDGETAWRASLQQTIKQRFQREKRRVI